VRKKLLKNGQSFYKMGKISQVALFIILTTVLIFI